MRGSATILGLILVVWVAGSVWWYTCKIKENCISFSTGKSNTEQQLIIDLEGEDEEAFYLKNAGNGVLQIVPGKSGTGIGMIKKYLDKNPSQQIDLVAQNEDHANGLLAMLIISGVPNNRVNVYTDPTLGSKERPMTIRSTFRKEETITNNLNQKNGQQQEEPESDKHEIQAEITDDMPDVTPGIIKEENKKEVTPEVKKETKPEIVNKPKDVSTAVKTTPKPYSMPCPVVDDSGSLPTISAIYYPAAASKARCTSALSQFATAASNVISDGSGRNLVITGFTDDNQNQVNNFQLALKRALEIKEYLVKKGVPGNRIETYSRGSDNPQGDNSTTEGRKLNRRVTIQWN